ncbi:hypothetical protein [Streptomyces sp. S186]|uniref:hypothetical protein n=1 Tax=Streptomyces sp. S186 TaxID=3434395 RepID=UPI003F67FD43
MSGPLIPVRRLRPGDHTFAGHGDDEVRRADVPEEPEEEVPARIGFPSRSTVRARERGRLVVTGVRELIGPDAEFTAARQPGQLRAATDRATAEEHTGRRPYTGHCAYDRRRLDPARVAARERSRPRAVPERLSGPRTVRGPGGALRFVGEADTAHRTAFVRSSKSTPARGATGHDLVESRCGRGQQRMLRRPGAEAVPRRAPREVVRPC